MSKETEKQIKIVCKAIEDMLISKNQKYGDSALSPVHIFSKAPANEQIRVRLDDKMSRIINSDTLRKNDTSDVIGYLLLLCINNGWTDFKDQID